MTNEHNLEGSGGTHSPRSPHPVSHWERLSWRKLQRQYPGKTQASAV